MKIVNILLTLSALVPGVGICVNPAEDILRNPEKAGGVYYAYPVTNDSILPPPPGYEPVYISHYGRHGSRWMLNEKVYKTVLDVLSQQKSKDNLTPLGISLIGEVKKGAEHTEGHLGELSPLGERQHREIAERLYNRFPMVFDSVRMVEARSSQVPRCIMSMAAFTEQLRLCNPTITINRHATPSDMDFLVPETPAAKEIASDDSKWRKKFRHTRDSLTTSLATAQKIFKNPGKVKKLPEFMRYLNDIAVSVQDVDGLDIEVLSLFTPQDNLDHWKSSNYIMYVRHARSSVGNSEGPRAAKKLMLDIMNRADSALAGNGVSADLRFGHDSSLIRLISLMDISPYPKRLEGADNTPDAVAPYWQTYEITPMAANLQLIFFRNNEGDVIVAPRYNEKPAYFRTMEHIEGYPGYYNWPVMKVGLAWNNYL